MKKWYLSAALVAAAMFLPMLAHAGGETNIPPPTEPIVIVDEPSECGCPQK